MLSWIVSSASSYAWWRPGSFDVTISPERSTPERRIASPTVPSFS